MTQYRWTAESGLADSTTLIVGNSGGTAGPAFTQVARDTVTPSVMRYRNANPCHGTSSLEVQPASAVSSYIAWLDLAGGRRWAGGIYIKAAAAPTAEDYIMQVRSGTGATVVVCSLKVTVAGLLRMFNATGGASVLQTGTVIPWALATGIRIEWDLTVHATAPTTTNGIFTASWYLGDSGTASGTITSAAFDLGAATPTQTRYMRAAAVTGTWPAFVDDITMDTAAVGFIGPPPVGPPSGTTVIGTAGTVDFRSWTPVTPGNPISVSLVQTSGPTTTPDEVTEGYFAITPNASASLVYTATISEAGGGTTTQTVTVPALSVSGAPGHAQVLRMVGGVLT